MCIPFLKRKANEQKQSPQLSKCRKKLNQIVLKLLSVEKKKSNRENTSKSVNKKKIVLIPFFFLTNPKNIFLLTGVKYLFNEVLRLTFGSFYCHSRVV